MKQTVSSNPNEKKPKGFKKWLKRIGVGGIIFFTVKGTITTLLIYFLGKNFWQVIKDSVLSWFE
jgi:hypothetical protein